MRLVALATPALLALALMAGCATGELGQPPTITDPSKAASVIIVRPSHFVGVTNSYKLAFDGADVYAIRSGQHVRFLVPAGEHIFTVKCFGGWTPTWKSDDHKMAVEPQHTYYLVVRPSATCAEIVPVDDAKGQEAMAGSELVQ